MANPTFFRHPPRLRSPADRVLESILRRIAVPVPVLEESKRRRDLVRKVAMQHDAARASFASGSIAHGTHNSPLGDADCGVVLNRRYERFRAFGPDAPDEGQGPEAFIQMFAEFITPRLRESGYPDAEIDLSGNRALKFEFNDPIDFDELGEVDPYVDLILGLTRREGEGLWIPNRREGWWDAAHPQEHTRLMTEVGPDPIRVARAHLIRLTKRPIKRDDGEPGRAQVMCSWNISALALDLVASVPLLASGLADFLAAAGDEIEIELTPDPAGVADPIKLLDGVSQQMAATRLREMAEIVREAEDADSIAAARRILSQLYGPEIDEVREQEAHDRDRRNDLLKRGLVAGNGAMVSDALGAARPAKAMASDGD